MIACSLIAIPTILAGCWIQYDKHIRELQAATPPQFWKYLDYNFYGSMYFSAWIALSSFIAIINVIHFRRSLGNSALKNWRKRVLIGNEKATATVLILLGIVGGSALIVPSTAITDFTIHVLGVADEEFDAYYPTAWWSRYYGWEIYIYSAFDRFRDVYGLRFELVGWISFDSDDANECPVVMLDEAIRETGFEPFRTTFNGKIIDLLMVFSAQYFMGCNGLSYPEWKAMLLCHSPEYPRVSYLCHEFSHQFYVYHCQSRESCCMYNHWEFGLSMPADWCQTCRDSLNYLGYYGFKNRFTYYNGAPRARCSRQYRK